MNSPGRDNQPQLANMTLDGLREAVCRAGPRRKRVKFIRDADDLIVTSNSRRLFKEKLKPAVIKSSWLSLASPSHRKRPSSAILKS